MKPMLQTLMLLLAVLLSLPAQATDLSQLYKKLKPSVAVLVTNEKVMLPNNQKGLASVQSLGSGVLISEEGLLLSAAHVVQTAEQITAIFADDEQIPARVISSLPGADIALLQLAHMPKQFTVVPLADSDKATIGEEVFVIGAPYGIPHTLTVGHLSGRHQPNRLIGGFMQGEFFQTDAAINQGNSGGPLFNLQGELLGVISYIRSQSGGSEGLGFAVASNSIKSLLLDKRPLWSGIDAYYLDDRMARIFNLPQSNGLLVQRIASKSPAARIGLHGGELQASIADEELVLGGDIILSVVGIPVTDVKSLEQISATVRDLPANDPIHMIILRGGKMLELKGNFD